MESIKTKIKNKISELHNLFLLILKLPPEYRAQIADLNLRHQILCTDITMLFSGTMFVLYLIRYHNQLLEKEMFFHYYGWFFFISISLNHFSKLLQHRNTNKYFIKNLVLYITIAMVMLVCSMSFRTRDTIINGLIIFAIIVMVIALFFYLRPLVFFFYITGAFILAIPKVSAYGNLSTIINLFVFDIVTWLLVAFKWVTLITDLELKIKLKEHSDSLDKELKLASDVQQSFYNRDFSYIEGWQIDFYSKSMAGVSGDLYDIYSRNHKLDGLGVFDISGHGIASGLVTMLVKNIIYQEFYDNPDEKLNDIVEKINFRFCNEKGNIENYLTGILVRINENNLEIVNAGHPNPILFDARTKMMTLYNTRSDSAYGVIGMSDFPTNFETASIPVDTDDEIVFYTDGIIEAVNKDNEQYGRRRFMNSLKKCIDKTPKEQIEYIIKNLADFRGDVPPNDDVTLVILKRKDGNQKMIPANDTNTIEELEELTENGEVIENLEEAEEELEEL